MEMFLIHFLFLFDKVSSVLDKLLKKRTSPVGGINITISQNSFKFLPQRPPVRLRKRCILSVQEKIRKEVERTTTKFSSRLMLKAKILRQAFLRSLPRLSFETQIFETETETFSETQILRHISHISMLRRARNSVLPTKLAFLVNKSLKNRTALPPLCKPFDNEGHYCLNIFLYQKNIKPRLLQDQNF